MGTLTETQVRTIRAQLAELRALVDDLAAVVESASPEAPKPRYLHVRDGRVKKGDMVWCRTEGRAIRAHIGDSLFEEIERDLDRSKYSIAQPPFKCY